MNHPTPSLILGSAMWGWTTPAATAHAMLDEWYAQGFREVDTATNYPIDKDPAHFRLAEKILKEWIKANGVHDLEVMVKVGSVNNLFTPEHILTKSFLLMMLDEYRNLFGTNLNTFMVHWDNRDQAQKIKESLEALATAREMGLKTGLSGIRHPDVYAKLNEGFGFDFRIQIKHNILHSDYQRYAAFHGKQRFITYGINAGGIKLDPAGYAPTSTFKARGGQVTSEPVIVQEIRDFIKTLDTGTLPQPVHAFYQVGMINAYHHPDILGILLGPSKVEQLKHSIDFYQALKSGYYSDVFRSLRAIISNAG